MCYQSVCVYRQEGYSWPIFMLRFSYYYSLTLLFLFSLMSHRYYSATILQMSGVRDDRLAIWLAGLTTLTNFLFTLLGVWLVERVGRRKLTLGSIIGKAKGGGDWSCPNQQKILKVVFVRSVRYLIIIFLTGTCFSLSLLAIGFLMSAQHSPPVTYHPLDPAMANSTCSKYQWVLYLQACGVSDASYSMWYYYINRIY